MCPHPPTSSQIRGFCNASTKVRVLWWLGCSGRPCLKVTTPHHHIISLPFHTSLSVWLIFKIKLHVLPGSAWLLFSHSENRQSAGGRGGSSVAVRLEILWWWQWWPFPAVWVDELCQGSLFRCAFRQRRCKNQTSHQLALWLQHRCVKSERFVVVEGQDGNAALQTFFPNCCVNSVLLFVHCAYIALWWQQLVIWVIHLAVAKDFLTF